MQRLRGLFGGGLDEEQEADVLDQAQERLLENPKDATARFDIGTIYFARRRYEEAVEELERTIELAPDDADAHYMLALTYEKLERYDDARRAFQSTIEKTDNAMLQGYAQDKIDEIGNGNGVESVD